MKMGQSMEQNSWSNYSIISWLLISYPEEQAKGIFIRFSWHSERETEKKNYFSEHRERIQ